jgi:hypothetical protein
MAEEKPSADLQTSAALHLAAVVVLLGAIALAGLRATPLDRTRAWYLILLLMTAVVAVVGHAITGYWTGILIDARNKMSLSRLQMVAWSLVILSALLTAVLTNVALGWQSPLAVTIPSELWVLLGISTASMVASPAVLGAKRERTADPKELSRTLKTLQRQGYQPASLDLQGLLLSYASPDFSRWADLLKGEEAGNAAYVDLGKLQMFFFTFVLVLGYGAAIAAMFGQDGPVTALPGVQDGMNVLLGISHTGYLANKAITHSTAGPSPGSPEA